MNAKEAKKIAAKNRDITDYVEKEVSDEVKASATEGDFETDVFVHKPDWFDSYDGFREKAREALIRLGYEVKRDSGHAGGFSFFISWEKAAL